jgi:sugar/nucleoside kinase (ribokinase family)
MHSVPPVDFLVIGHMVRDVVPDGYRVGGTATYAAYTAHRLGWRTGVLTRVGPDLEIPAELVGVTICRLPATCTTTFENIYQDGERQQFLHVVAPGIGPEDVPIVWRKAKVVLLGPLDDEVDPGLAALFPNARLGVTPQGWMRAWDTEKRIHYKRWTSAEKVLAHAQALVVSEEDLRDEPQLLSEYAARVEVMVVTQAARGATLYWQGQRCPVAPRPTREVDPTGAGDVFAAAFLIRWWETDDPLSAARFANVVASFSVEGPGITAIPSREQVEAWLADHPMDG